MSIKPKAAKIILGAAVFIIACLSAAAFFALNSPQFRAGTARLISEQATGILGNKVSMDSLELVSFNSAAVDDLELFDNDGDLIVKADKVVFHISIWDALTQSPLAGVAEIDVQNPEGTIERRSDGSWNFEDLLDSQTSSSNDFKGTVKVNSGTLTLRLDGKQITVQKVNLTADCADIKAVKVDGSLAHEGAAVEFEGTVGSNENTNLEVKAQNLDILNYLPFIPEEQIGGVNIKKGSVNKADLTIRPDFKGGYTLGGFAAFEGGACEVQGYDVENINGIVIFDKQDLQLFVRGESRQQSIAVHGQIKDYMTEPELILTAESQKFAPAAFVEDLPFEGDVSFNAAIYGKLDDIRVGAEVKADKASVYGFDISDLKINARYAQNKVYVDDLEVDFAGGWLWLSGQADLSDMSYKGTMKASQIDLSVLNGYLPDITGTGTLRADFKGQGTDFGGLDLSGRLEVNGGSWRSIPIEQVEASFYKQGSLLQVDAMTASFADGGRIAVKGGMDGDSIDADFYASGVDLALAQQFVPDAELSGTANFSGHLYGNRDNPILRIEGMAQDGAIMKQPFDSLLVSAVGNLDGMRVDKMQFINKGEVTHEATGLLGFKGKQFIDMTVKTNKARMENIIAAVMPDLKLTGNVDNTLHLTGSLADIKAEGSLHFYEGSINGILLSEVNGTYEYKDGDTYLHNFAITSPFIKAQLDGSIDSTQNMNFKFTADEISLGKLQVDLPYPVEGKAAFSGTLSGRVGGLEFDGILTAGDILLNGQQISDVYGRLKLSHRILSMEQFSFYQKNGSFNFNGSLNANTKEVKATANLVNADLNSALAIANLKNDLLNGNFNGRAELSGTYEHPHVVVNGSMPQGSLKDFPLNNIVIDGQLDDTLVKIDRFYGEQGAGRIAAQGSVDLAGGPLEGRISASNMDVNLLSHLCDLNMKVNGTMNGDVQLSGTLADPQADITLSAQGDKDIFDTAFVMANVRDNTIYINQAAGTKGDCAIKAEGTIPIAALDTSKRDADSLNEQMNLRLYLENTDLNVLPTLTPYVDWAMGNVQGDLNVTGTVASPKFKGSITTKDSAIKFKYIDSPFQNMNADIEFSGSQMTVKQFNGVMGSGTYDLQGSTLITGEGLKNYNFNLNLNHLDVVSDYYTGPLNGSVQINEIERFGRKMPKLTVNTVFSDITVAMPPLPETSDDPLPLMALDVNVGFGDDVHFYDPQLYDLYLKGGVKFQGTTRRPDPSGVITAENGSINVLKTIFKIQEGTLTFNQIGSFMPYIDFLAITRLDRTRVFAEVKGVLSEDIEPRLFSDPPMSQAEIIKLLAFRTGQSSGSTDEITEEDLASFASIGLQMTFLNELEGTMRNVLNLDEFRISRDTLSDSSKRRYDIEDGEVYNIEMGKYLSDKVMLKYTKGINYDLDRVGLQYYINNNIGLLGEVEDGGQYNIKVEMQWKF